MKKQLLATLGLAALCMASYAATLMRVTQTDGSVVEYDVEKDSLVDFYEKTAPVDTTATDTTQISNHAYVDLGLPSGTLWATYNIGATKPEEFGDYFAWGETEPKEVYDWSTYKYAKASGAWNLDSLTKYNSGKIYEGTIDNLLTLLPEDDAATANWGSEWRMPTNEEQRELVEECQYQMTEVNGVYGAKFTGKNGNSVFFPAAGDRYGSDAYDVGDYGYSWSSSLYEKYESIARNLSFYEGGAYWDNYYRYDGFPVRAVLAKK
ncbi:MAG: hypothetical protein MJZ34_08540 [Paludibacteraceae bacterium]|nr:hypothetical protein [Paludibacteraceae bacterium]